MALAKFLAQASGLGPTLGPLLLQLPPKLMFDASVAAPFLTVLRGANAGDVVCEPRHSSWFDAGADALLADFRIARVAADPAVVAPAALPGAGAASNTGGYTVHR